MNASVSPYFLLPKASSLLFDRLNARPQPRNRTELAADEAAMRQAIAGEISDILLCEYSEYFFERARLLRESSTTSPALSAADARPGSSRFFASVDFGSDASDGRGTGSNVLSVAVRDRASEVARNREFADHYHCVSANHRLYAIRFSAPPSLGPCSQDLLYALIETLLDTGHQWFRTRFERLYFAGARLSLPFILDKIFLRYLTDKALVSHIQYIIDTPDSSFYCFNEERIDSPLHNIARHLSGTTPELILAGVADHLMPASQKFSGLAAGRSEPLLLDLPYERYRLRELGHYPQAEIAMFLSPNVRVEKVGGDSGRNLCIVTPVQHTSAFQCLQNPMLRKLVEKAFLEGSHSQELSAYIKKLRDNCSVSWDPRERGPSGRLHPEILLRPGTSTSACVLLSPASCVHSSKALLPNADTLYSAPMTFVGLIPVNVPVGPASRSTNQVGALYNYGRLTETHWKGTTHPEPFRPPLPPPENPTWRQEKKPDLTEEVQRLSAVIDRLSEQNRHLGEEKIELQEQVAKLRATAEHYMKRFGQFEVTILELQAKYDAAMERIAEPAPLKPEASRQEEELPEEIIAALSTWPEGRRTVKGVDGKNRKENAEQYIERIFFEHYDQKDGVAPEKHAVLPLTALMDINVKLYHSLTILKSRRGKDHNYPSCISLKPELVSREVSSYHGHYDSLPPSQKKRLEAAERRRRA